MSFGVCPHPILTVQAFGSLRYHPGEAPLCSQPVRLRVGACAVGHRRAGPLPASARLGVGRRALGRCLRVSSGRTADVRWQSSDGDIGFRGVRHVQGVHGSDQAVDIQWSAKPCT
jgi:hypothetical protein